MIPLDCPSLPEELLALVRNGLAVAGRFGDYDERPFAAGAPKQLLVCRAAQLFG